jgi:hypothetical protein
MEHKLRDEAYIILHLGVLAVGVTSVARESESEGERERGRERKRGFGLEVSCLRLPLPRPSYSACLRSSTSCARVFVRVFSPLVFVLCLRCCACVVPVKVNLS